MNKQNYDINGMFNVPFYTLSLQMLRTHGAENQFNATASIANLPRIEFCENKVRLTCC